MTTASLEVGSTVEGYKILAVLGRGGMGRVFKVQNIIFRTGRSPEELAAASRCFAGVVLTGLSCEIKVLTRLEHSNITVLHGVSRGRRAAMICEYVEGSSLDRKIKQGKLGIPKAVHYICQALGALSYAHNSGVFHREVKPSNILISRTDT